MFAGIASRYDLANRVISGGLDVWWRRKMVRMVRARQPANVVDLACGSGDVAFALKRGLGPDVTVVGTDFCEPMLEEARRKKLRHPKLKDVEFRWADCLDLPFSDESVDALTIAFGLRNLEDRRRGLREMLRVLRPGGALYVLEFSQPTGALRPVYYAYLRNVIPWLARFLTGDKEAYEYLAGSVAEFPGKEDLAREIQAAGFKTVHAHGLFGCIVAIHEAVR